MMSEPPFSIATPFAGLTPEVVLGALDAAGLWPDGRLLQLNSYENRVWQAHLDDGRVVVVKFYRPGRWSDAQIVEEHRFAAELADAELPMLAPLALQPVDAALQQAQGCATLAHFAVAGAQPFRLAVWERRVGRAPELDRPDTQAWLGRLLGRMHQVGRRGRFVHRRPLNAQTLGHAPRQRLIDSGCVRADIHSAWLQASAQALACVDAVCAELGPQPQLRLHGDCHPGNVLWRDEGALAGPHFVDLDDCGSGPAIQDLWMLLPTDGPAQAALGQPLLAGYRCFCDLDDAQLRLIEPLRTLRMIHHSAWLAERWADPAFPPAFPWFASPAYWQQQARELWEQVERMGG